MKPRNVLASIGVVAAGLLLVGCNIFNPFDSPTSDAQLLSVARACFDRGDFECARENYGKLSSAEADRKNSEEAFLAVQGVNAGMGAFISAFGQDDVTAGAAITSIANSIGSNASRANRVALFAAYGKAAAVSNTQLRGLTRFVTAVALMANMLAEDAATPGDLRKNDISVNGTACAAAATAACNTTALADCANPSGNVLVANTVTVGGDGSLDGVSATDVDTAEASLQILNAAITTINDALGEMNVTSTASNLSAFTTAFGSLAFTDGAGGQDAPCYRQGLVANGVGR